MSETTSTTSTTPERERMDICEGERVPVEEVHEGDVVLGHSDQHLTVQASVSAGGVTNLTLDCAGVYRTWRFGGDRPVRVITRMTCHACSGSGRHYSGGGVVNGVYTGKIGECFACRGKGEQNRADITRNYWYWKRYARI